MAVRPLLLVPALLLAGGCNDRGESVDDTVFLDQVRTLDRADAVEQQVLESADRRRQKIDTPP